jgi:hypothetical protein
VIRRFHCDAAACRLRIFAERFGNEVLAPFARRTPAASLARRPQIPVSNDTLIRVVRLGMGYPPAKGAAHGGWSLDAHAITSSWSNGRTEGQITKLKLVKHRCTAAGRSTSSKHA